MRILLDTNILISGLLRKDGPSGELLHRWVEGEFLLVTSEYQVQELRRAVGYEHLRSKILPAEREALLDNIDANALVIKTLPTVNLSPDPDDNPILATAIAGNANLIVSGNKKDMQYVGDAQGIPIVTPREALERLAQ